MAEPLKTSSFQLPDGQRIETAIVKLVDGRIVGRTREELVSRPAPPRVEK